MTIADDTVAILAEWGQTVITRRKAPTYSDTGAETLAWAQVYTGTADIQPRSGLSHTAASGLLVETTHVIEFAAAVDVKGGDRVRPFGWAAGDDEYEVLAANVEPDHVTVEARKVVGHAP